MSYDLRVWTADRPRLPEDLPRGRWAESPGLWSARGRGWQLGVAVPIPVEPEDVPPEVHRTLPGLAFLTEIHVEPGAAPGRALAGRVGGALARSGNGVVEDPQTETLEVPRGVQRYRPEPGRSVELLALSWWWLGSESSTEDGLTPLLALLGDHLPEALPRRYGLYEPPEHRSSERGPEHLVGFLRDALGEFVVLYPSRPVLGLTLDLQATTGHGPHGFVANHLRIDVDRSALAQPGWTRALRRTWRGLSELLTPFYGDVRTLRGYERRGSRLWVPPGAQDHPVDGPFWAGVPRGPAHAFVLGAPYRGLWPGGDDAQADSAPLRFESVPDWLEGGDVFQTVGPPPEALLATGRTRSASPETPFLAPPVLPRVWPFRTR